MFKKKEKTEKAPKNKKVRTMKVGTHKKSVLLLWAVLLASTSFGVYKNFTAIDTHTVHEKEIIQLRLNDTNGIENFVKNFAKAYYSWDTSKEAIEARTTEISKYLTKELQDLNSDTIRTDTKQCDRYKCAGLECRTVWNGRFYRCLRSRSAGKRGRTDTGSHRKLHRDRSCG